MNGFLAVLLGLVGFALLMAISTFIQNSSSDDIVIIFIPFVGLLGGLVFFYLCVKCIDERGINDDS